MLLFVFPGMMFFDSLVETAPKIQEKMEGGSFFDRAAFPGGRVEKK
jgi:hypothetical protein